MATKLKFSVGAYDFQNPSLRGASGCFGPTLYPCMTRVQTAETTFFAQGFFPGQAATGAFALWVKQKPCRALCGSSYLACNAYMTQAILPRNVSLHVIFYGPPDVYIACLGSCSILVISTKEPSPESGGVADRKQPGLREDGEARFQFFAFWVLVGYH